jgi:membrane-bound ClpP family serine protease
VIILGIVLLIIGVLAHLNILYTTGLILIVLGVILCASRHTRPGHRRPAALVLTARPGCWRYG